jgi:cytochrome c oxidase cbb3-type subunit 2
MQRFALSTLVTVGFFLSSTLSLAASQDVEKLYLRHCAACHGEKGDGQGPGAYLLFPKPRDFTRGVYKFRSTPTGAPPTDTDLLRTLKRGVAGTSMPPWDRLSEKELTGVIEHVKSFSDIFMDEDAIEPPIVIKASPSMTGASVKAGRHVYKEMECDKCHGEGG